MSTRIILAFTATLSLAASYAASANAAIHGAGTDRDQAVRACAFLEQKTSPPIKDSNLSMFKYRACMDEHGQVE